MYDEVLEFYMVYDNLVTAQGNGFFEDWNKWYEIGYKMSNMTLYVTQEEFLVVDYTWVKNLAIAVTVTIVIVVAGAMWWLDKMKAE